MFLIRVETRHALPLTGVRFSRTRISRGPRAKCPRGGRGVVPHCGHKPVRDPDVSQLHPRTRRSLGQAVNAATPQLRPCPRLVRIQRPVVVAICPKPNNVRAQPAERPRSRTGRELAGDSDCSCPTGGIVRAAFNPRSRQDAHHGAFAYVFV